jgi:hypothetical protein
MPIVEVVYGPQISTEALKQLAETLPHAVSVAVECPEEPYDGHLQPGDVEIRFRALGPRDVCGLGIVVEVRSKWFASRASDREERCARLREFIEDATGIRSVGVYLALPVAGWSQSGS